MNPWLILGVVLAWLGSLVSVGMWQNEAGKESERVVWQQHENEALKAANTTIERLNREARAREHEHAANIATIGETHAHELRTVREQRDRDVAAARAGRIVLRVPGACPVPAGDGRPSEAGAAPAGGDGATDAELPGSLTEALLGLAHDADEVVRQLTACQKVVMEDRR